MFTAPPRSAFRAPVDDCGDIEGLLRRANIAMHVAKECGGNRAIWFDNSMESVLKARNEVESGLRRGIPLGEFAPYYQPQYDLKTGQLRGFEALARWNHPAGGVVGPDLFIPIAEETGLIGDLFESIFHQALQEARDWNDALILSVNVSPGQLKDPWLAHRILKILTEVSFPAERLEIEITESSLFENLADRPVDRRQPQESGRTPRARRFRHRLFVTRRTCARFPSTISRSTAASSRR